MVDLVLVVVSHFTEVFMAKTIAEMNLSPVMKSRAEELVSMFPNVKFTSGRRTLHEQAHAMAVNYIQDKQFLTRTYIHAAELMQAVEQCDTPNSVDGITEALYQTLEENPDLVKGPHLSGDAVDIAPMEIGGLPTPTGMCVIEWIKKCPDTTDFRTREGNLSRWH